jgi:acetolactate synthase I/II/III large subunit
LLDAAAEHPKLTAIRARDHRIAACIAAGHAVVSNRPAVVALTTGPAFSTAIGGLIEAASVGAPLVVVTTRVGREHRGRGAFQELDQKALSSSFVTAHVVVESAERLNWALGYCAAQAMTGRRGVAIAELTPEALAESAEPEATPVPHRLPTPVPAPDDVKAAADLLRRAKAPVVVAGGGARADRAGQAIEDLLRVYPAAFVATASGRGVVRDDHENAVGLAGLYMTPPADQLLNSVDVVLAIGTRLEETMRIGWPGLSAAELIHVDVDPASFGLGLEPSVALFGLAAPTCRLLAEELEREPHPQGLTDWSAQVTKTRQQLLADLPARQELALAAAALGSLSTTFPDAIFVQENGLHDLWGYHWPILQGNRNAAFVTPGEQTMMGYGVGASIGASVAAPDRPTVLVCGDGALEMSLAALPTAAEYAKRLLIVVLDNSGYGWPRAMRTAEGASTSLTDVAHRLPVTDLVRDLGGEAITATTHQEMQAAVAAASDCLSGGTLCLIRLMLDDSHLPPCVAGMLEGH